MDERAIKVFEAVRRDRVLIRQLPSIPVRKGVGLPVGLLVLLVGILSGCASNHPPQIAGLAAEKETVLVGSSCVVECTASDPDGDALTYGWRSTGGRIEGEGEVATWQAPQSPGMFNILVEVKDPEGATAYDHVSITVKKNLAPSIVDLSLEKQWVKVSGSLELTCTANDADGDPLTFAWSADSGNFAGQGPTVTWSAPPNASLCEISVEVSDDQGGTASRSVVVSVTHSPPPVISNLKTTPQDPAYFEETAGGFRILKEKACTIECIVQGDFPVTYSWSATAGNISGSGAVATWTAPDGTGEAVVRVVVADGEGNMTTGDVLFRVENCKCVFH